MSLKHVVSSLCYCKTLTVLKLQLNNSSNPVCSVPGYRSIIVSQMPWINNLDGVDKFGNIVIEDCNNLPGLDEYLDLLETSSTSVRQSSASVQQSSNSVQQLTFQQLSAPVPESSVSVTQSSTSVQQSYQQCKENKLVIDNIVTPKIDSALLKHKQRNKNSSEDIINYEITREDNIVAERLDSLEDKLHVLVDLYVKREALMQEVNAERERRWKAEQASNKLMENMKKFQERIIEDKKFQDGAVAVTEKLKEVYNKEKRSRLDIENLYKKSQEENLVSKDQIKILQKNNSDQKKIIFTLQEAITKLQKEKDDQQIDSKSKYQNLQFAAGGVKKELELLQFSVEKQKDQIIQLQELLLSKECEHKIFQETIARFFKFPGNYWKVFLLSRKLLEGMIPLNGKEVQELLERAVFKEHQQGFDLINQYKLRLEEKQRECNALEDEFRMALQIESSRYKELHEAYEQNKNEFYELSVDFKTIKEKEVDGQLLIDELTSLVKEQKLKIAELVQRKQDDVVNFKDQIKTYKRNVTNLRKLAVKIESLQQDKDRMVSHIRNQEAVVQGLRSERKCWSEELAQQSSLLVLDCNKLNDQVEAQKNEISILNNKLTDLEDAVKIKTKMILDQTDTIKNLKMEIVTVKNELEGAIEEYNKERLCIEEELEQEKLLNKNLQEKLEALNERKNELKEHLSSSEKELTQWRNEAKALREKWKERSEIIDQLETKVLKMKNSFDEKEKLLQEENQLLKQNIRVAEEKLLRIENEQEKERDIIKHEFELRIRKIITEKDDELQIAKHQIICVEEEMRDILVENANQKKIFESRIKKLSNAFTEVQNGFI